MMPKSKQLIALLLTILTIGAILFLQSTYAPLATVQVATLCLIALGLIALAWVILFIYPSPASLSQPNQNTHITKIDTNTLSSTIANLFNTMQSELKVQISATEVELNQVKSLMDKAIDDLVDSFVSLEATTRIGQNLVSHMISNENNNRDELNPFRDRQINSQTLLNDTSELLKKLIKDTKQNKAVAASLADLEKLSDSDQSKTLAELHTSGELLHKETKEVSYKVAGLIDENKAIISMVADEMAATNAQVALDVQTAIKSLQFQDTTIQLITQCTERLNVMQKMLNTIESLGQSLASNNSSAQSLQDWQTKVASATDKLKEASNVRMKQFNVDPGSVELFT